ncbi:hypothetical protein QQ045_029389 [Rhodiola kirilowii]
MYAHLIQNGMMMDYTTWTEHGEVRTNPSIYMLRQQYIMEKSQGNTSRNSGCDTCPTNPTLDILNDAFPFRDMHQMTDVVDDSLGKDAYEKYSPLLFEAQTPIFDGSNKSVLDTVLKVIQMKVDNGTSRTPRSVVRYFPLTPRLQRLYMFETIAKEMRWHGERRVVVGHIRHPADGEAWQDFNKEFPEFASEIRSVRLGLETDGFNPF